MSTPDIALDDFLSLDALAAIAAGQCHLTLTPAARARLRCSADTLAYRIETGQIIYGINTGFGPLADRVLDPTQGDALQRGLIRHLSAGVGLLFSRQEVRAIIAARIANLVQGWSGVSEDAVDDLLQLLAVDCIPAVPQQGTVGASGDLTPLAHIVLAAIGEGRILANTGTDSVPAAEALERAGLRPLRLAGRAGLALVNGTSAMTAIAALNGVSLRAAIALTTRLTLGYGELMGARVLAWHPRLAEARRHPGHRQASNWLWQLSQDSTRLERDEPRTPAMAPGSIASHPVPQDPYSLRCAPQELGAALDLLDFHNRTVETELNAACDNPLIDVEQAMIHHGGNFYGQPVAYATDTLALAVIKLAIFAERAIARLTDERLNGGLPPFLSGGRPGLDSGFMGAQVTATALVAEMRTLAMPASIQSIPTNANNQDVVTMGTIGARRCRDLLDSLWRVLAIEALAVAQGMDLCARAGEPVTAFSSSSRQLYQQVRDVADVLNTDRPLSADIEALATTLRDYAGFLHPADPDSPVLN